MLAGRRISADKFFESFKKGTIEGNALSTPSILRNENYLLPQWESF